jgi:hypothetical protein
MHYTHYITHYMHYKTRACNALHTLRITHIVKAEASLVTDFDLIWTENEMISQKLK